MVNNMEVNKVADMVVDMEVDKVADMVVDGVADMFHLLLPDPGVSGVRSMGPGVSL